MTTMEDMKSRYRAVGYRLQDHEGPWAEGEKEALQRESDRLASYLNGGVEREIADTLNAIVLKAEALSQGRVPGPRYGTLRLIKANLEHVIDLVGDDRAP